MDRLPEQPTRVIHRRDMASLPKGTAVYIGRPSRWGNPFVIGKHGTRLQVISLYRDQVMSKLAGDPDGVFRRNLRTLRGKVLACYCAPEACHGDVLAELADLSHEDLDELVDEWTLENRP